MIEIAHEYIKRSTQINNYHPKSKESDINTVNILLNNLLKMLYAYIVINFIKKRLIIHLAKFLPEEQDHINSCYILFAIYGHFDYYN